MKMFKMMAASMLGVALCLGFTACSDDDENENGEGGENTATVVNPSQVLREGFRSRFRAWRFLTMKKGW
jgi:hypothetical protein